MNLSPYAEFKSNYCAFQIWNGGMINQFMGVQFAAATSGYFEREVELIKSCNLSTQSSYLKDNIRVSLSELIDLPTQMSFTESKDIDTSSLANIGSPSLFYFGVEDVDFANGRKRFILEKNVRYFFENTLCNYSMMFSDRPTRVDKKINDVNFKKEYHEFANYVASCIGDFNGLHLRLTDFSKQILLLDNNDILDALSKLSNRKIVVSTDDPMVLKKNNFNQPTINIAELIITEFLNEFKSLSISNEITLGLVSLLIMAHSLQFIGTPMSTYSNHIHRLINQKNKGVHDWRNIGVKNRPKISKYSWDSYREIPLSTKLWSMDWPESLLVI